MSGDSINIRSAVETDMEAMVDLLQQLFSIEADFAPQRSRQVEGLRHLLASDTAVLLVAESAGQVVGMCSMQVLVSTAEGGPVGLIEDVVVSEDRRGCGIGSSLMQAMEQRARQQGISRIQLLADQANTPALDFYRHLGWSTTQLIALRRFP